MANIDSEAIRRSWDSRRRPSVGVTLVAGYGPNKPDVFLELLSALRSTSGAVSAQTDYVELYDSSQVHATIIGLEGERIGDSITQDNIRSRFSSTGSCPSIKVNGLLDFLVSPVADVPITIGGFRENAVNPFDRQRTPFERSFDVRADGLLVAMGWPVTGSSFLPSLVGLRKYMEKFNVVHKYHVRPEDQDNDLFFVVGEVNADRWQAASPQERATAQKAIDELAATYRLELCEHQRTMSFPIRELKLVKYERTSLAQTSCVRVASEVDAQSFLDLYDQPA